MSQKKLFIWLTTFSSLCGPMVISEKKHKKGVIHGKNHKGLPRSDWLPVVPVDFAAAVLAGFSRFRSRFQSLRRANFRRHYRTLHQQDGRYRFPQRRGSGEYSARELFVDRRARSRGRAARTARFPRAHLETSVKRNRRSGVSKRGRKGFRCARRAPILPSRGIARRREAHLEPSDDSSHP